MPGVNIILLQCCLEVVSSDVGVDTGMSKVSLSPPTVICTLCVYLFWGLISYMIRLYVTLATWGTLLLWMKKELLVPLM